MATRLVEVTSYSKAFGTPTVPVYCNFDVDDGWFTIAFTARAILGSSAVGSLYECESRCSASPTCVGVSTNSSPKTLSGAKCGLITTAILDSFKSKAGRFKTDYKVAADVPTACISEPGHKFYPRVLTSLPTSCSDSYDLIWVIDESGSIQDSNPNNWPNMMSFLNEATASLAQNTQRILHTSAIQYFSTSAAGTFSTTSPASLQTEVATHAYANGGTNIEQGLEGGLSLRSKLPSTRRSFIILLTDGVPTHYGKPAVKSTSGSLVKARDAGVKVMGVANTTFIYTYIKDGVASNEAVQDALFTTPFKYALPRSTSSAGWDLTPLIASIEQVLGALVCATPSPTGAPTTAQPTERPTEQPSKAPTRLPTTAPTDKPTAAPTDKPTAAPTGNPTARPTDNPTARPTDKPSAAPSPAPTDTPSAAPTDKPSAAPTDMPSAAPTGKPSAVPTAQPTTSTPTAQPTTKAPTGKPTESPTVMQTNPPAPPTVAPTSPTTLDYCTSTAYDLSIVVDQSGSVGPANDALQRAAIKAFVQRLKLGPGKLDSRVAYTTYSKQIGSKADFTAGSATGQSMFGALVDEFAGNAKLAMQGTNTGPALFSAYSAWTSPTSIAARTGSGRTSTKVAIIITDGMPNNLEGCGEAGLLGNLPKSWRPASIKDKELKSLDCTRRAFALIKSTVDFVIYVNMGDMSLRPSASHAPALKGLFQGHENAYIEGTYSNMGAVFDRVATLMCSNILTSAPTAAPTLAPTRTSCSYAVDAADCNKQPVCVWRPKNKPADRCAQLSDQCAKLSGTTCQNHPDCDWQPKSKKCNLKASASIATTNFTPKPTAAPK